mmetsp:Transcript_104393/g.204762  ORF Transcript_104393/g.204762 Transcript_104393/m.204762 type:complete len:233 (+) Transcript_104393:2-700(+)
MKGVFFILCLVFVAISTAAAEFQIELKNLAGNTYNISCGFVAQSNNYGTDVNTKTVESDWVHVSGNEYELHFERIDSTHAQSGRCETAFSDTLYGDGVFTAHIYIHSNVPSSAGVFTVAMMTDPFSQEYELDLFVANLADNELKTGQPGEAAAVPMSQFVQKWVTVYMTKQNGYCQTNFYSDSGTLMYATPSMANCYTNGVPHQIVVNGRARDSSSYDSSFITIDSVTWKQI